MLTAPLSKRRVAAAPSESGSLPSISALHEDNTGWTLARELESDQQHLRVFTKTRRGELSFRFEAVINSTAVELVSMCREADLMPTWISFCSSAGVWAAGAPVSVLRFKKTADLNF